MLLVSDLVVPVRAGVFEEEGMSGVFAELNPEQRQIRGWTLGSGLTYKRLALDLAWVHSESDEHVFFSRTEAGAVNGVAVEETVSFLVDHFKIVSDRVVVSLIVRF